MLLIAVIVVLFVLFLFFIFKKDTLNDEKFDSIDSKFGSVINGPRDPERDEKKFKSLIEHIERKTKDNPEKFKKLGDLYLNGVPQVYDRRGRLRGGVAPNVSKALRNYKKATQGGNREALRAQTDIYRFGVPGFEGNDREAQRLETILDNEPNVEETPTYLNPVRIPNDGQNVHDTGVNKSVKASIERLEDSTNITIPLTDTLKQIRGRCIPRLVGDKNKNATKALDYMEVNNAKNSSTDIYELELLNLIWNRINSYKEREKIGQAIKRLGETMSECVEHNNVVCAIGRFNRLVDSLNKIDKDVEIKSNYAIDGEMMDKAGNLREEFLERLTPKEKEELEKENSPLVKQFKDMLLDVFEEDYEDIMSREEIEKKLNTWGDDLI